MTRKQIAAKMAKKSAQIKKLVDERQQLFYEDMLLSDSKRQYKEETRTFGRGKSASTHLMGFVTWKECFTDEDTGEKVYIDRRQWVRKDGNWIV